MLLAEIKGKYDASVQDHEDYLTSTVFSHLRYVSPGPFWRDLFSKAKALMISGVEETLTGCVGDEHDIESYQRLDVYFWPKCPGLGEPELAMCFTGGGQKPLVVLVEVKLWAPKSGHGEHDQLKRYLQIADTIEDLRPPVPANARVVVVYLTPRESLTEIEASLRAYGDSDESRRRLFRLQWKDVIEVIDDSLSLEPPLSQKILSDVRDFLRVRRLEYFSGFGLPPAIRRLHVGVGSFYTRNGVFTGFCPTAASTGISVTKGQW